MSANEGRILETKNVIGERDAAVFATEIAVAVEQTTRLLREVTDLHGQLASLLGTLTESLVKLEERLRAAHEG
jgi:hypothetical protein